MRRTHQRRRQRRSASRASPEHAAIPDQKARRGKTRPAGTCIHSTQCSTSRLIIRLPAITRCGGVGHVPTSGALNRAANILVRLRAGLAPEPVVRLTPFIMKGRGDAMRLDRVFICAVAVIAVIVLPAIAFAQKTTYDYDK